MSTALIHSRAQSGIDAPPVQIEVHLSGGLPGMSIVGLPEAAVRTSPRFGFFLPVRAPGSDELRRATR